MKLSKKTWMIIGVVAVIALIYWLMKGKNKSSEKSGKSNGKSSSNDLYIYAGYGIVDASKQPSGLTPIASYVDGKYYKISINDCPTPPCGTSKDQINANEWNTLAQTYAKK